ncbi:protein QUIRKY-like [Chenopodium quinoa]|uniref:C2 domain-containing protein n=1 Tax=Chenopodium quinoa TaxID=63459 RepID=A0A803MWB5_CHEQI|nr:protein QUIRKY-like [Chenopodium quinoa]
MATVRKLIVEVVDARNLLPKDGHGTSSPYVVVDFYGQRKRTKTVIKDLNPSWNEALEFNMGGPSTVFGDTLEIDVYHDKNYGPTRRHNHLGRVRFSSSSTQFVRKGEEALMYFPLEKKYLLSWIQGEIGLKIYYSDEASSPPPPSPTPSPVSESPAPVEASPVEEKKEEEPPADTSAAPEPGDDVSAKQPDDGPPLPPEKEKIKSDDKKDDEELPPLLPVEPSSSPMRDRDLPPEIEVMASTVSGMIPEVKVADDIGIRPPPSMPPTPAISRTVSTASFESIPIERSTFDLVEKMHYLFVRVVKARSLPTNGCPVVKIVVSNNRVVSKPARKTNFFEWDQTFAFGRDSPESSAILEVSVWDPPNPGAADPTEGLSMREFLGGICFDTTEIPLRDPPDSPLAPQWYRLEGGGANMGDLMLATWVGTQADESFPEAWKTDTAGNVNSRAKVYLSPKLWYLRATILDAQDILFAPKESMFQVKAQLGIQVLKTKPAVSRNGSSAWNEDLMFVAAEPFGDQLVLTLEYRGPKGSIVVGVVRVALTTIERRVDDRNVVGKWFTFDDPNGDEKVYKARVQLRMCFDGGYHVMEEAAHMCSDYRPTARQLWKPAVGMVELGIIGCTNLLPAKAVNGKGSIDAYAIAKYGPKWVRTRTVSDCLDPKWNEQYTWKVYDPCTVLTIGVFDSSGGFESDEHLDVTCPDSRVGKVRIRISTLHTGKVYRNSYPLLTLTPMGLKKMGDIELAVRFVRSTPNLDVLQVYSQPLLPLMHHIKPLAPGQQEMLRIAAVKILAVHLSRSEPPLRQEVVRFMLDADSHTFSMRKVRANWFRIINLVAGVIDVVKWIEDTRTWKNPTSTILVHALLVMLVWFPDLIIPTLAFYVFVIGAWNYRFRSRDPLPHFDPKISLAGNIDRDELDEEFDIMPSNRPSEVVRARYDKLRTLGARVQTVLGDLATQGERIQALVTWRDPRATGIFVGLCFVVAIILYLVPSKMVAMASGFYYLRHPMFRDRAPSPAINFIRRLPSKTDRLL